MSTAPWPWDRLWGTPGEGAATVAPQWDPPARVCSAQESDNDEGLSMAAVTVGRCHLDLSGVPTHPRKAVSYPALPHPPGVSVRQRWHRRIEG